MNSRKTLKLVKEKQKVKKVVVIVTSFTILSGCVSTKNIQISQQNLKQLNPNNVALTTREKPSFSAMTAGKAMFALVGAAAMIAAGNEIVEENNIEDPASYIQSELAKELMRSYSFKINETEDDGFPIISVLKAFYKIGYYAGCQWTLNDHSDIEKLNFNDYEQPDN